MSYVYTLGGNVIQASGGSYQEISFDSNIQLAWPTQFQDVDQVTAAVMYLIPTAENKTVTFPNAKLASQGQVLLIINDGIADFDLKTFGGSVTFPAILGSAQIFILRDNTSIDGGWGVVPAGEGVVAVTSVAAETAAGATSNNLHIAGSPITSAGTFVFSLIGDLLELTTLGPDPGFAVRTAANTWELREIHGSVNQIVVTNQDGVSGSPIISLAPTIVGINNLTVANLNFSGGVITTTGSANLNLLLSPDGTGRVVVDNSGVGHTNVGLDIKHGGTLALYGTNNTKVLSLEAGNRTTDLAITMPSTNPSAGQVIIAGTVGVGVTELSWATIPSFIGASTVNALARFADTFGSLANSTVLLDNSGNLTQVNSAVIGNIQIGVVTNTDITTTAGALRLSSNGSNAVVAFSDFLVLGKQLQISPVGGGGGLVTTFTQEHILPNNINYLLPFVTPKLGQIPYISSVDTPNLKYQWEWNYPPLGENLIVNGGFDVWQRNTSFNSATQFYNNDNNTYIADMWKLQSNGDDIVNINREISLLQNPLASCRYSLKSTVQTANTKFGYVYFWNNKDTDRMLGRDVIYQLWNTASGVSNLRAALIEWKGAADAPTSNIVSSWNVQGVDPTLAANWSYRGTTLVVNAGADPTFVQTISPAISIPTSTDVTNMGLFIWCDSTASTGGSTWEVTAIKLEFGRIATPYQQPLFSEELERCYYLFQKDLNYADSLGTINIVRSACYPVYDTSVPQAATYAHIDYKTKVRTPVAPVTYAVVDTTATNVWSKATNAGFTAFGDLNLDSAVPVIISESGFVVQNQTGALIDLSAAFGNFIIGHWYVDAGFN